MEGQPSSRIRSTNRLQSVDPDFIRRLPTLVCIRWPVSFLVRRLRGGLLTTGALFKIVRGPKEIWPPCSSIRGNVKRNMRVSDEYFPMISPRSGGTIYQWELGWHVSAVQVARSFGHSESFDLLMERSPADEKLLNACWLHDEAAVRSLLAQQPNLATQLMPPGQRQLAHAARNNDTMAARLMLEAGLPVDTYTQHHATPLHWAAWHGSAELVGLILRRNPPLDDTSNDYEGTPVDWAVHGSQNGWSRQTGDYAPTLEVLLEAGAPLPGRIGGTDAVQAVLRRNGMT
jgi:hypothetical protein